MATLSNESPGPAAIASGRVADSATTADPGQGLAGRTEPSREGKERLRLLVVEDEPADVELMLRCLRKGNIEASADVAQTEQEFTERLRRHSYDLILADYKLPNWNGMESVGSCAGKESTFRSSWYRARWAS